MCDGPFFIRAPELVNGIYLLSSTLVHFPALRDMCYVHASLIRDSAVASSMSKKEYKSLRSTALLLKDIVIAKTEGDHTWGTGTEQSTPPQLLWHTTAAGESLAQEAYQNVTVD